MNLDGDTRQMRINNLREDKNMEGLLLGIGFIGLILAILTPQSKLGVALTLGSFAGYFTLVGTTNWFPVILFVLGIVLIVIEVFIPGFGAAGIVGALLLSGGLYLTLGDIQQTLQDLVLAVLLSGMMLVLLLRNGYSFKNFSRLVLQTNQTSEKGYSSSKSVHKEIKEGLSGTAVTNLRPSGKAAFQEGNVILDVLSESGFIQSGQSVSIKKINGSKIIVRSVNVNE